jgi:hypothetical protein
MAKNLFDHIKGVTFRKVKWEDLSDEDRSSWNNYMINRFFSMEVELVELINEIQKYSSGILTPETYYKLLYDVLPKQSFYLKYIKSKNKIELDQEFVDIFCKYYQLSRKEVYEYIGYLKKINPSELVDVLKMYGTKESEIENFEKQLKNMK